MDRYFQRSHVKKTPYMDQRDRVAASAGRFLICCCIQLQHQREREMERGSKGYCLNLIILIFLARMITYTKSFLNLSSLGPERGGDFCRKLASLLWTRDGSASRVF